MKGKMIARLLIVHTTYIRTSRQVKGAKVQRCMQEVAALNKALPTSYLGSRLGEEGGCRGTKMAEAGGCAVSAKLVGFRRLGCAR